MATSGAYLAVLRKAAIEKAVDDLVTERRRAAALTPAKPLSKTTYRVKVECLAQIGVVITSAALKMRTQRRMLTSATMLTAAVESPPTALLGLASGDLGGNDNSNEEEDWGGDGEDTYMFDDVGVV